MKIPSTLFRIFLGLLLNAVAAQAGAFDAHLGGFGTASLSCFNGNTADYVVNDQPEGPGRTRNCDAGLDSLLGLQLDLALSKALEFGLQVVADRNENRSYTPDVTVAQLRWRPTDTMTVRLGRMPTPLFLHSEDRQVRYAMPWVRPPLEVYGLLPTFSNDGLEIIQEGKIASWHTEWQGGITAIDFDSPLSNAHGTYPVKARQAFLNLSLDDRGTLVKLGYSYGKITARHPGIEALLGALRGLGTTSARLADDLTLDQSTSQLVTLGVRHEQGNWLAMGEFAYRTIEGYFRDQYGAYATLGRHFGPWMPYVTAARRWTQGADSDSRAGILQSQVQDLLAGSRFDTSSVSLGLSREINDHATLKLQADWIRPDRNSWGLYTNHAPNYDYANPGSNWLLTVGLDFVF